MKKRILFNLNTFTLAGNIVPLIYRINYWQKNDFKITIFSSYELKSKIEREGNFKNLNFIELSDCHEPKSKIGYIFECLRRNLLSLKYLNKIVGKYEVIFTISSVLDLVILPYFLKRRKKDFLWLTICDNTVPFTGSGNKIMRVLIWFFFITSIKIIKNADKIFVISEELVEYFLRKGFQSNQIVLTGNGVETDLIHKAKKCPEYNIDALFIGRINEAKGIYQMLKVLKIVIKKIPKFQLALMGIGDSITEKRFHEKIASENLSRNIQLLGYKTGMEKYNIIKSSRCFWFFSESESFAVSLAEAVVSGIKCFVYYLPVYKFYNNNEIITFDQGDYKGVAKSVIDIFQRKDFNNENGKLLAKSLDWQRIVELEYNQVLKLIENNE